MYDVSTPPFFRDCNLRLLPFYELRVCSISKESADVKEVVAEFAKKSGFSFLGVLIFSLFSKKKMTKGYGDI